MLKISSNSYPCIISFKCTFQLLATPSSILPESPQMLKLFILRNTENVKEASKENNHHTDGYNDQRKISVYFQQHKIPLR